MGTNSDLKSLIWDITEAQTDLINLGNDTLKQTGSFVSWVKCHLLGIRLPFKSLSDRADSLDTIFTDLRSKLNSFKNSNSKQLTEQDKQAFELTCEFAEALSLTASVLKTTQAKYLSASQGKRKLSFREVCEDSQQYNESTRRYFELSGRLQPHINRIFKENRT